MLDAWGIPYAPRRQGTRGGKMLLSRFQQKGLRRWVIGYRLRINGKQK
jgi:hypothetical protein